MSRKKILIPLAKRHTHHRTLALRASRTHLSGFCLSEGASLCPVVAGEQKPELSPTAVVLGASLTKLCLFAGASFARFESRVFFQERQCYVSSGAIPLFRDN